NQDLFAFFFSSRRRHTRFSRDWSSDVCSSDLLDLRIIVEARNLKEVEVILQANGIYRILLDNFSFEDTRKAVKMIGDKCLTESRSEERRVGKESRAGWWQDNEKKKHSVMKRMM